MLQTLKITRAPTQPYILQATLPLPADFEGPIALSQEGRLRPSESRVIARTRSWQIRELVAEALPGKPLEVTDGELRPERDEDSDALRWALTRGSVFFHVQDERGTITVSLTGPPSLTRQVGRHRIGRLMQTSEHHRSLGRFGWLLYSMTVRKGIEQIDFCVDWHNCLPGPDVRFTKAWITSSAGTVLKEYVVDETWLQVPSTYCIPQMRHRPIRFTLVATNAAVDKEHLAVADWSKGGLFPSGFPVPAMSGISYVARLQQAISEIPMGRMWIPQGSTYGGETGGNQMWPLYGVEWAASGDADALAFYRLEQLRNACRDQCQVGSDGQALRLEEYLTPNGSSQWRKFDNFERVGNTIMDQPWGWSRWAPRTGAEHDPRAYADHDLQHDVRDQNEDQILYWLAYDWLAKHQLRRSAANARMVYWEGSGPASRSSLPSTIGLGTSAKGRDEAWAAQAVAVEKCIAPSNNTYDQWAWTYIEHDRRAQMPSGLIQATWEFKEAGMYPFGDNQVRPFLIHAGNEECYFALSLWSLHQAFPTLDATDVLKKLATGFENLGVNPSGTGVWSYAAVGPNDLSNARYVTRAEWPAHVAAGMGHGIVWNDAYHLCYATACFKAVGAPEADQFLLRFTAKPTVEQAVAEMRRWLTLPGMNAPSLQTGATVDQYWSLLGVYTTT